MKDDEDGMQPETAETQPQITIKAEKIDEEIERKLSPSYIPPPEVLSSIKNEPSEEANHQETKYVEPLKSSNEILAELFKVFNAVPPSELLNDEDLIKHTKKRKKEKKEKKKKRKRSRSRSNENGELSKKRKKKRKKSDKEKNSKETVIIKTEKKEEKAKKVAKKSKERKEKEKPKEREKSSSLDPDLKLEIESEISISDEDTYLKERRLYSRYDERLPHHEDDRYTSKYPPRRHYDRHDRSTYPHKRRDSERDRRRSSHSDRRNRSRSRDGRRRSRSRSRNDLGIDKKRLLEIARKNAITMFKNGSLPGCADMTDEVKDKVLLKMRYGGKSVQDLTDFCKKLTSGNHLEDISDLSSEESDDHDKDGNPKPFNHPFAIKEREPIVMNIKNAIQIPPKTTGPAKAAAIQMFPVSSGQDHRRTEQWVPVSPKKDNLALIPMPPTAPKITLTINRNALGTSLPEEVQKPAFILPKEDTPRPAVAVASTTATVAEEPKVFPSAPAATVDVSSIITKRLSAMRRLQENPMDSEAIKMIYSSQKEMSSWAVSKNQPGKFTGSTGVTLLSAKELSGDYNIWAKKDQLKNTVPVNGGMGMHLLQKMGWKPGEGLGKEKNGQLQPLLLDVKIDKRGLAADYAEPIAKSTFASKKAKKKAAANPVVETSSLADKHPVSLLNELAAKRRWQQPMYHEITPNGNQKQFLFNIELNGQTYESNKAGNTKKDAKFNAARFCLQQIGILPTN